MDRKNMTKAKEPQVIKITKIGDKINGELINIEQSGQHDDGYAVKYKNEKDGLCVAFVNKLGYELFITEDLVKGDVFELEFVSEEQSQSNKNYKYRKFELYFKKVEKVD